MEQERNQDGSNHQQQNPLPFSWQGFTFINKFEKRLSSSNRESSQHQVENPVASDQSNLDYHEPRSLAMAQIGDRVRILSLNCGESNNRLIRMGFTPGAILEVISRTATGSVVVALQDHRLGLGAEMAQQIQVIHITGEVSWQFPQP